MKYKVELWCDVVKKDEFESDNFKIAKDNYLTCRKEYDDNYMGCTEFKVDDVSMSLEWKYEHLLGLDFNKILAEQKKVTAEILKDLKK